MPSTSSAAFVSARPRFQVDGQDQPNLNEAALAVKVRQPLTGMASAEVLLLNWGNTGGPDPGFLFQDLSLGSKLDITLGGSDAPPCFTGEITALEERFGEGAPQLTILAEDKLHRLARGRASQVFADMSLDDVVQQLASQAGLSADVSVSSATGTWLQVNESPLAFLLRELAPYDVSLRVVDGSLRVRDEEPDPAPFRNAPERARLIADLNHQPTALTVKGYNLKEDATADSTQSTLSPAPAGQTAYQELQRLSWASPSFPPHPFARSQSEAEALAQKQFRQKASRFVHGELTYQGDGSLRSGREVEVTGLSSRFNGKYRVVSCEHSFDSTQGFCSHLQVQRPDWGI